MRTLTCSAHAPSRMRSNYTLKGRVEINPHAANLHRLPNSRAGKVPNGLLVSYTRHYSSAQRNLATAAKPEDCP